jgi:uncharacterized membrane protein
MATSSDRRGSAFRPKLSSILFAGFLIGLLLTGRARAQDNPRGFVESIASGLYAAAWPTATYESVAVKSIDPVEGGFDVLVKLSGKSSFDDGELWMIVVVEVRNGALHDVRVARHNAILSPPFSTTKALAQLISQLAEENSASSSHGVSSSASESSSSYRFYVRNGCRHPIRLAIKYRDLDKTWKTVGWWNFAGSESSYLSNSDGKNLRTTAVTVYYYAEAQDGSFYWSGGRHEGIVDGRTLPMLALEDKDGDTELPLLCAGR